LEEYVADCVIILDQRIHEQISTRRLRALKYCGTAHGTNEYPFLIGERGLSVLPITSPRLDHQALHRASFYRRERRISAARFRNRGAMGLIPGHTAPSNVIFNPPGEL
jgi:KaiC/GvpD/RAD55 family RecA-like ATPase